MNSTNLAHFITENEIEAEIVHLREKTPTVAAANEAVGVRPYQIVKSEIVEIADR